MTSHMTIHTDEKTYECDVCDSKFRQKQQLTTHKALIHYGVKKIKCTMCDALFSLQQNLKKHEEQHYRQEKFVCKECGVSFPKQLGLSVH